MKWNAAHAVFALALAAALAGQAHAACDSSERIVHGEADCLWAKKENKAGFRGKAEARNECSEHGTVVAKVDRKAVSDWTWHLSDGNKRSREAIGQIRDIYCCSDLSVLCNISELDDEGCLERFEASSADESCSDVSAEFIGPSSCKITAHCTKVSGDAEYISTIEEFRKIKDLHNCDGRLKVGECW